MTERIALRHRVVTRAARLWWRITQPRTFGVRAIIVDPAGRIALVRHTYTAYWYLPGGGVKKGESAHVALARELREEVAVTGFAVERVLGVYHSRTEGKDDHVIVYVARASTPDLVRADLREIAEAAWFALDALPDGISPATTRRIGEYREGATGSGAW